MMGEDIKKSNLLMEKKAIYRHSNKKWNMVVNHRGKTSYLSILNGTIAIKINSKDGLYIDKCGNMLDCSILWSTFIWDPRFRYL